MFKPDQVIDCVGLYCPMPIVNTAKKIKDIAVGQILEVIADDEGVRSDLPNWCKATGNELLGTKENGGVIHTYIRKLGQE